MIRTSHLYEYIKKRRHYANYIYSSPFNFGIELSRMVTLELDGPIGDFGSDFRGKESHDQARRDLCKGNLGTVSENVSKLFLEMLHSGSSWRRTSTVSP